jgi:two-component system, LytTR family, response regulator
MGKIKIGIVEDEAIIADDIAALLGEMGYECTEPSGNYSEAIVMLMEQQPDLAILDINLGGKRDGVDIAHYIRTNLNIPFIFLTANSDAATVVRAKETWPNAYLVKPFHKADLYTAIEIALHNFNRSKGKTQPGNPSRDKKLLQHSLFIKEGDYFHKVNFDDILYLASEHVYITVCTTQRKFLVRASMQEYLENFDPARFVRVHRGHVVNIDRVEKINTTSVIINGIEVPLSRNHRDELLKLLNIG